LIDLEIEATITKAKWEVKEKEERSNDGWRKVEHGIAGLHNTIDTRYHFVYCEASNRGEQL